MIPRAKALLFPLLILLSGIAVSCSSPEPFSSPVSALPDLQRVAITRVAPQTPTEEQASPTVAAPATGRAAISGVLYTSRGNGPVPGTVFYLTPAQEGAEDSADLVLVLTGPNLDHGDVRGQSGSHGEFVVNNISPGSYYLVVWAPYGWIPVPVSEQGKRPRLITLAPNETKELGRVTLPWP